MRRPGLFLLFALLLAVAVGLSTVLRSADADTTTSTTGTCAALGEACPQPSPHSASAVVLEHIVYAGGCWQTDLHMLRYVPANSPDGKAVVATWCS